MKKRSFTIEQVEFVRLRVAERISQRKIAEEFSKEFEPIGQTELRRLMKRNGIESLRAENKMLPVGTERWSNYYQCIIVKVTEYSVAGIADKKKADYLRNKQWKLKQNLVWEQTHGKILPWRHIVVFLDGDRTNYDPDNLYAVSLAVAGSVEKWKLHSEHPDIYKTALRYGELYFAMIKEDPLLMDRAKHSGLI